MTLFSTDGFGLFYASLVLALGEFPHVDSHVVMLEFLGQGYFSNVLHGQDSDI